MGNTITGAITENTNVINTLGNTITGVITINTDELKKNTDSINKNTEALGKLLTDKNSPAQTVPVQPVQTTVSPNVNDLKKAVLAKLNRMLLVNSILDKLNELKPNIVSSGDQKPNNNTNVVPGLVDVLNNN